MNDSERLAMAAHLHVALRRKLGRVTDTEWMAGNREYGLAMVDLALVHAHEHLDQELGSLALRFGAAISSTRSARSSVQREKDDTWTREARPAARVPEARFVASTLSDTRPGLHAHPREAPGLATAWPSALPSTWPDGASPPPVAADVPVSLRRGRYVGGLR